jgi:hypothetical protein
MSKRTRRKIIDALGQLINAIVLITAAVLITYAIVGEPIVKVNVLDCEEIAADAYADGYADGGEDALHEAGLPSR